MNTFKEDTDLIYKFVPYNLNTLKMLIENRLWFGVPKNLNDPFECEFKLKESKGNKSKIGVREFYEKVQKLSEYEIRRKLELFENSPTTYEEDFINEIKRTTINKYGISCFSTSPLNVLMWSHYADAHKGICLVFSASELLNSLKKYYPEMSMEKMIYRNSVPSATLEYNETESYIDIDNEVVLTKLSHWQYENEIRFFIHFKNEKNKRDISFEKLSLKSIIFGQKIDEKNRGTLIHLFHNINEYDVNFWQAKTDLANQTMLISKYNYVFDLKLDLTTRFQTNH